MGVSRVHFFATAPWTNIPPKTSDKRNTENGLLCKTDPLEAIITQKVTKQRESVGEKKTEHTQIDKFQWLHHDCLLFSDGNPSYWT